MNPKLSIITPSFNQASYLEETILSVLQQNYQPLEFIVIDGGSIDHSPETIRKYQDQLHYWISEKDRGQPHALTRCWHRRPGILWLTSTATISICLELLRRLLTISGRTLTVPSCVATR